MYICVSVCGWVCVCVFVCISAYENLSQARNLNLVQIACKLAYIPYANNSVLKIRHQS